MADDDAKRIFELRSKTNALMNPTVEADVSGQRIDRDVTRDIKPQSSPLESVAPRPRLAAELRRVAESARNFVNELAKNTNFEVDPRFPKQKLIDVAGTLIDLSAGSEDGALPALEYAETALNDMRFSFVEIAEGDPLPDIPRGGRADQSLVTLISDIGTAKRFLAHKSSGTTLAPPEPPPEAGLTLSIATGKLDLVPGPETSDAFDRATQIALHRRINRQIEPLRAETAKGGNRHPSLARAVDEYATLVSKPFDELDVVDLWAVGNGLLAHAYSFEHQDKKITLTEPLEPSHLALLLDVSRLHAGFILGFPKGIELTERADHASIGADVASIINASILEVLAALSRNSKLVSDRARRLAEVLSDALIVAGWQTARVGYTSYALVRNALIQLGKVSIWVNDKGGSLVGTVIVGVAASTVPRETWELAGNFLSTNASNILAFAAPFPELRVWIGWIIDQFDGERSSANLLGKSEQRSYPSRPDFSIFDDDFEDGTGQGPDLVVIPAGEFLMGSAESEARLKDDDRAYDDEIVKGQGKRPMRIARRFALGRYPVTFEDYDAFLDATKAERKRGKDEADDEKWGRGRRPAINVSWDDAQAYCDWLNEMTGLGGGSGYRLPSEAEWEYACRAGTTTRRWWGDEWDPAKANGNDSFEGGRTSPVEHYPANPWGLHDMIGNVWEWFADLYAENIAELPQDGTPYVGSRQSKESSRVLRGGSWVSGRHDLRSADRGRGLPDDRSGSVGFRVARTL